MVDSTRARTRAHGRLGCVHRHLRARNYRVSINMTSDRSASSLPGVIRRTRGRVHHRGGRCCIQNNDGHRLHKLGGGLRSVLIHGRSVRSLLQRLGKHCSVTYVIGLHASSRHTVVIPSCFRGVLSTRSNSFGDTLRSCYRQLITPFYGSDFSLLVSCSFVRTHIRSINILRCKCAQGSKRGFLLAVFTSQHSGSRAV